MILELKGIYKNYIQGKMTVPVLKDVNFSMDEGEYVAIMGPSGSGKTTLMNIIGCLDKPTEGIFLLDGQDIRSCSENDMSDNANFILSIDTSLFAKFKIELSNILTNSALSTLLLFSSLVPKDIVILSPGLYSVLSVSILMFNSFLGFINIVLLYES